VSFSNDADQQAPWHGHAIHRLLNARLGLHVTSSCWVHAAAPGQAALFVGVTRRNDAPSGVEGLGTAALLLREWHRGNLDHFHGWTQDDVYRLRDACDPAVRLGAGRVRIELAPTAPPVADWDYRDLRLYLTGGDAAPPPIRCLELRDAGGARLRLDGAALIQYPCEQDGARYRVIEALLDEARLAGAGGEAGFRLARLVRIDVVSDAGAPDADGAAIAFVERDNFSRTLVERQRPALERWNVRPNYCACHGGFSMTAAFGEPTPAEENDLIGTVAPPVVAEQVPAADAPASHARHDDVLRALNVGFVYPFLYADSRSVDHFGDGPLPELAPYGDGFRRVARSYTPVIPRDYPDAASFAEALCAAEPSLDPAEVRALYLPGKPYWSTHGEYLGLLVALSCARATQGRESEHFWTSHFGTVVTTDEAPVDAARPFPPGIRRRFERLAEHHYGVAEHAPPAARVWVAATGVFLQYRLAAALLADAIRVDGASGTVRVAAITDAATGRRLPAPGSGTRDLHGVTVYVEDAAAARLEVDGTASECFTRNPPDESGAPSITIVSDRHPTPLLDRLPAEHVAHVRCEGGRLVHDRGSAGGLRARWRRAPAAAAAAVTEHRLEAARGGHAHAAIRFLHADCPNTSHLQLRFQLERAGAASRARASFALDYADGHRVVLAGAGNPALAAAAAWWEFDEQLLEDGSLDGAAGEWRSAVLAADQLRFAARVRADWRSLPALPALSGEVRALTLALDGCIPGDRLRVDFVRALRPSSNGLAPDGHHWVAGRVLADGRPAAGVAVECESSSGRRRGARTDALGGYELDGVAPGEILSLRARVRGRWRVPRGGPYVDVRKDEAEVDFLA